MQAAQGLTTIGGGGDGGWGVAKLGGEDWEGGEGKGVGDCEGGEEDEDGGEFENMVWMGTWIGIGR